MNKRAVLLAVCIFPNMLAGMDKLKSFADRYPKITGALIGGFVVADAAALLYFLQKNHEQKVPLTVDNRTHIITCNHTPREKPNGNVPYLEGKIECHDFRIEDIRILYYKNLLDGMTDVYEEDRKDIRIILKKFPRRDPGGLKTLIDEQPLAGRLIISFCGYSQTQFDKIDCTILLPRDRTQYFQIKIIGDNGSSQVNPETILYQKN